MSACRRPATGIILPLPSASASPISSTPALLVLTAEGALVNADTAQSWRNAATRSEDAIHAELAALAEAPLPAAE